MYFDTSIVNRLKKERSAFRLFLDRLFFPLIVIMPDKACLALGLTPIDEERIWIVNRYIDGRILDVGCGNNIFVKSGRDGVGIDVYPWEGVDIIVKDTSKLEFRDGEFDSVLIVAALNHIPERIELLNEAHRVLRPGGRIILTMLTPFISYITHKIRYFYDQDQTERKMKDGEVWGITRKEMHKLLSSSGFHDIFSKGFVYNLNRLYVAYK